MTDVVASGIPTARAGSSSPTSPTPSSQSLRASYGDFELRPRIGTELWLGDRKALQVRATVLDVHEVRAGRRVRLPRPHRAQGTATSSWSPGGTAHGIGLEAPTGGATLRDRAARVAKGGLDAAGFVRSPFTIERQATALRRAAAHAGVDAVPARAVRRCPTVGAEVDVRVRFTATAFDRTVVTDG